MKVTGHPPRRVAEMMQRRHESEGALTGRIHCKQVGRRDAHCDGDRGRHQDALQRGRSVLDSSLR
jgi:hypothetical protein